MLKNSSTIAVSLLAALFLSTTTHATTVRLDASKIKADLRTAAPEEDGFVDRALQMVEEGKLSSKLVESTFAWARKQPRRKFQYFKRGLLFRAPNAAVRSELAGSNPTRVIRPPTFAQTIALRLRRLLSFLPSVRTLLE